MERIAHWLSASGVSWTSSEAVPTGSEHQPESGIGRSSSTMVAVLPDPLGIYNSAVQRPTTIDSRYTSNTAASGPSYDGGNGNAALPGSQPRKLEPGLSESKADNAAVEPGSHT